MAQILENNVSGVLGLTLNLAATSMTLIDAAGFPAPAEGDFYLVTLIGLNANGQEDSWEIVRVTAKASNTLTVVRAQEGTQARSWASGTTIQMRLTKGSVVTPNTLQVDLATKVDKVAGKGLSSEDYTLIEKNKLQGIQAGAQVNPTPVNLLTSTSASLPLSANQGRELKGSIDSINALLQSDDSSLDELQEIVNFVKLNRTDLNALGINSIAGLASALAGKQPLSPVLTNTTESFTSSLLSKLNGIAAGAQVNSVTSVADKTGSVSLVKADVGLSNVDNTSDASKPISTAQLSALNGKVDKVTGKGLSSADFTAAEKSKLTGIAAGAQVNTVTSVADKTGEVSVTQSDVGLANVDNTSDLDKPISNATDTVLTAMQQTMNSLARADLNNVTELSVRTKAGTGTMAYRNINITSGNPSGGVDGDVHFKV